MLVWFVFPVSNEVSWESRRTTRRCAADINADKGRRSNRE